MFGLDLLVELFVAFAEIGLLNLHPSISRRQSNIPKKKLWIESDNKTEKYYFHRLSLLWLPETIGTQSFRQSVW